jgi:hypothetical protein
MTENPSTGELLEDDPVPLSMRFEIISIKK